MNETPPSRGLIPVWTQDMKTSGHLLGHPRVHQLTAKGSPDSTMGRDMCVRAFEFPIAAA